METLVAHTPATGTEVWHTLEAHTLAVARLAREFAAAFGGEALAYRAGILHDTGKANPDFQGYLQRCYREPDHKGRGPDHKAAGATIALGQIEPLALLIQGHHGGLKSREEFAAWYAERRGDRVAGTDDPSIERAIERMRRIFPEIDDQHPLDPPAFVASEHAAELFLRMLFSTLVDADYLDTEAHGSPHKSTQRGTPVQLTTLLERFLADQQRFAITADDTVSQARSAFYQTCVAAAVQPPGLFQLAIPTGGGKTRSGMAFALHHAVRHGMRRVVVAVPYLSITEQTADVYRSMFQRDDEPPVLLEHHSGAESRNDGAEDIERERWRRLASENWDAPLVVTTTVQLFESLFASSTSRCRKLHRLANSVIILDEVQALPTHLLGPIASVLRELVDHYGVTVVLSTATQPAFEQIEAFTTLRSVPIVADAARWFTALSRVRYSWRTAERMAWGDVADLLRDERQALAILNTKPDALALLDALGDAQALHLSTLLCGAHRRAVIADVRQRLSAGAECRLVSTQVVEAGVDIDFPLVLRAMGPLDRIIQAAGRCNREGRLPERGRVIIFEPADATMLPAGAYRTATDITRAMVAAGSLDPDAPATVSAYFRQLFRTVPLDRDGIQQLRSALNYSEVARRFRLIDDDTEEVIVAYGSDAERAVVRRAIELVRSRSPFARQALRQIQPYTVSLRARAAQSYRSRGLIEPIDPEGKLAIGVWHGKYDLVRGIVPDDDRSLLVF